GTGLRRRTNPNPRAPRCWEDAHGDEFEAAALGRPNLIHGVARHAHDIARVYSAGAVADDNSRGATPSEPKLISISVGLARTQRGGVHMKLNSVISHCENIRRSLGTCENPVDFRTRHDVAQLADRRPRVHRKD